MDGGARTAHVEPLPAPSMVSTLHLHCPVRGNACTAHTGLGRGDRREHGDLRRWQGSGYGKGWTGAGGSRALCLPLLGAFGWRAYAPPLTAVVIALEPAVRWWRRPPAKRTPATPKWGGLLRWGPRPSAPALRPARPTTSLALGLPACLPASLSLLVAHLCLCRSLFLLRSVPLSLSLTRRPTAAAYAAPSHGSWHEGLQDGWLIPLAHRRRGGDSPPCGRSPPTTAPVDGRRRRPRARGDTRPAEPGRPAARLPVAGAAPARGRRAPADRPGPAPRPRRVAPVTRFCRTQVDACLGPRLPVLIPCGPGAEPGGPGTASPTARLGRPAAGHPCRGAPSARRRALPRSAPQRAHKKKPIGTDRGGRDAESASGRAGPEAGCRGAAIERAADSPPRHAYGQRAAGRAGPADPAQQACAAALRNARQCGARGEAPFHQGARTLGALRHRITDARVSGLGCSGCRFKSRGLARALALPGRRSHRRPGAEWARSRTERARSRFGPPMNRAGPEPSGPGAERRWVRAFPAGRRPLALWQPARRRRRRRVHAAGRLSHGAKRDSGQGRRRPWSVFGYELE
jgi:hypothetical protein